MRASVVVVTGGHRQSLALCGQDGTLIGLTVRSDRQVRVEQRSGRLLDDRGHDVDRRPGLFTVDLSRFRDPMLFSICAADGRALAGVDKRIDSRDPPTERIYGRRHRRYPVRVGSAIEGWVAVPHSVISFTQYERWYLEDEQHRTLAHIIKASRADGQAGFVVTLKDGISDVLRATAIAAAIYADDRRGESH